MFVLNKDQIIQMNLPEITLLDDNRKTNISDGNNQDLVW